MGCFSGAVRQVAARVAPFFVGVPALTFCLSGCTGVLDGSPASGAAGTGNNPDMPGATAGGSGGSSGGGGLGATGGSAGTDPGGNPDPGSPIQAAPTWRLTNREYVSSVRDLLGVEVRTPLDPDGAVAGYRAGLVAGDATVSAYYDAAIEAASAVDLRSLVACDAAAIAASPAECAGKLVDDLGTRAFRRPLDGETRAALLALHASVTAKFDFDAGTRAVVEQILQSPYFLYHLELEERALGTGAVKVSGYSMASRLSYLIWGSMPDSALFSKAAAGELSTPEQITAEARRLIADPRAKVGLQTFYEQWLHADTLAPVKTGKYTNAYDSAMRASILASFNAQVDAALWSPQNGVNALMNGTQAFVNQSIAPLFGVSGVTGNDLQPVNVNPAERAGIISHPAIMGALATENGTNPIKRGVFVWDQLLCQELPNPPNDVPTFPGVPENASVRTAFETFTSAPRCMACHSRINPVGFLFENYDTLGAYTNVDDNGQPVVAAGTVVGASDPQGNEDPAINKPTATAVELGNNLAGSTAVAHCLVKQLYRFTLKRVETSADEATINTLAGAFTSTAQNLPELLLGLTQSEAFLNRWNQE
jgi:hypothetical protein